MTDNDLLTLELRARNGALPAQDVADLIHELKDAWDRIADLDDRPRCDGCGGVLEEEDA